MEFFGRTNKSGYRDNYYLYLAVGFCIALRILTPQMIGFGGGDAVESWDMARRILFHEDYYFIHRTARFGTIIPVYLTQLIFGINPIVYYLAPAIASVVQTVFLYKTAELIRGRSFAFICTILYLSFPQTIRDMSHPRVSVFAAMFFLISFYYALKFYTESRSAGVENKSVNTDLFISGINVFFMYMAKEDSLYFLPAIMIMVYLGRKKFFDLVLFGIIPFSLFLAETFIYHYFTEFSWGRLSVITGKHFETVTPLPSWISLLDRFKGKNLRPYFRYPIIISLAGGIYLLIKRRGDEKYRLNPVIFIVLSLFSYLFFMTFLVKSIHPVVPLNTFRTRYLNIIIPPMILIITYLVYDLVLKLKVRITRNEAKVQTEVSGRLNMKTTALVILAVYTAITAVIFFHVYKNESYKGSPVSYLDIHPFLLVPGYYSVITSQYNSGKPFLIRGVKEKDDRFSTVVETVEKWVRSGLSLNEACSRYGISTVKYAAYKRKTEEHIKYEAEPYAEMIFTGPGGKSSGFKTFDMIINGIQYRVCYNSRLTTSESLTRELEKEKKVYPELVYPPMQVIYTTPGE